VQMIFLRSSAAVTEKKAKDIFERRSQDHKELLSLEERIRRRCVSTL
jgi:hypothetical protein